MKNKEHSLPQNFQCSLVLFLYKYVTSLHFPPGGRNAARNEFFLVISRFKNSYHIGLRTDLVSRLV